MGSGDVVLCILNLGTIWRSVVIRLQVKILRFPVDERLDGPSADVYAVGMRAISTPCKNRTVVVQSVASHYNDRLILGSGTVRLIIL
jgi:hypothetical protein